MKLIHSTHSHPYPTLLGKEWGYNPALPSGFTWKLNTIDESGDRMYFSELKNEFRGRVPNFFELYIPHHDEIKIKYNHEKVIRTVKTSPFGKLSCFSDKLKLLNLICKLGL